MSASQRQRAASAVAGKTARVCDGCAFRRARWYCAADDAFLCQGCDASVHSANPLARRHERVRLKTSSAADDEKAPAWHQGFKRKVRTPRPHQCKVPRPVVPDLDTSGEETGEEQQLLYRVPILEPMLAEFCSPLPLDEPRIERKAAVKLSQASTTQGMTDEDFAADVESLLGAPLHDDSFCMEGLIDLREGHSKCYLEETAIKEEQLDQETAAGNGAIDAEEVKMLRNMLDIDVDEEKVATAAGVGVEAERVMLRLDYEAIIAAWSSNGSSPWTGGERPQLDPYECWPEYMGMWGEGYAAWGACGGVGQGWAGDGDREARVTRYREKRRTRLFSKKIRYEVRKLNAEKRPRLKGRFVKRASFAAAMAISYQSYGAS